MNEIKPLLDVCKEISNVYRQFEKADNRLDEVELSMLLNAAITKMEGIVKKMKGGE
jgi:hypothetical protein